MALFRPDQNGAAVAVGPLEAEIMDVVWTHDSFVPVPDVHRALTDNGRVLSYSAVKAVLNNLAGKGLLEKDKVGKVTRFRAAQTREEFDSRIVSDVIGGLKRNYGTPAIAQLVGELAVDEESLDMLEAIIAKRRSEMRS